VAAELSWLVARHGARWVQDKDVWLRTAVDVGSEGWAHFDYVKMPDYRWGIFSSPRNATRRLALAITMARCLSGSAGRISQLAAPHHRHTGDTEPASVEQQRLLGHTCPSLYDLRNLFQVTLKKAGISGRWFICCRHISAAMAATKLTRCWSAAAAIRQAAHPGSIQPAV